MTLRLNGSTSGYTEIDAPPVAGSNTLLLPTGNGTANQALVTDGSGALSWADRGRLVLATAQASTSGTSIDFTGIPSWVKRITLTFVAVSTSGTSNVSIQLGTSGGVETTGYVGTSSALAAAAVASANLGTGFTLSDAGAATNQRSGLMVIMLVTGNTWAASGSFGNGESVRMMLVSGAKAVSGTLDRIRATTANGTDTFDGGTINILYEG